MLCANFYGVMGTRTQPEGETYMKVTEIQFPKRIEALPRVAAYARVSSGKDAMLQSLSSQVSYYSSMIQSHPG